MTLTILDGHKSVSGWTVWPEAWGGKAQFEPATGPDGSGAIRFTGPGIIYREFPDADNAAWNQATGISFWVKGDGSGLYGAIAVGPAGKGSWQHGFVSTSLTACVHYFPLGNTNWHRVTVAWEDFMPEGPHPGIGRPGGFAPADIRVLRFGSRWMYWRNQDKYPRFAYEIGQIELLNEVARHSCRVREEEGTRAEAHATGGVARHSCRVRQTTHSATVADVQRRMRRGEPVRILCVGDSLTAGNGAAPGMQYWAQLQPALRRQFDNDQIVVEGWGIGGATLLDALPWIDWMLGTQPPDLITLLFGANDSNAYDTDFFRRCLEQFIERSDRASGGRTALLPLTTVPGPERAGLFAESIRQTMREQNQPFMDLALAFETRPEMFKAPYSDGVHLNATGHRFVAETLRCFFAGTGSIVAETRARIEALKTPPIISPTRAALKRPAPRQRPRPPDETDRVWRVTPRTDLQAAIDQARPGDVIELAPGLYRQRLVFHKAGKAGAPLVMRAKTPGAATLTGAVETPPLNFEPIDGLYRTAVSWQVKAVTADGRYVWPNRSLEEFVIEAGPGDGFYQDGDWLYVRLRDGRDLDPVLDPGAGRVDWMYLRSNEGRHPGRARIEIAGPEPAAAMVRIDGAEHLVIEGLRFAMAPDTAVFIARGAHITVRDCHFSSCRLGIGCAGSEAIPGVVVEHCEYSGYPVYQWCAAGRYFLDLLSAPETRRVFLSGGGPGWVVRNNFIHECVVGIELENGGSTEPAARQEVGHNLIINCAEAGIRVGGEGPRGPHARIHNNLIVDARCSFALGRAESLRVERNIAYHSWHYAMSVEGLDTCHLTFFDPLARGIAIVHNTFVSRRGQAGFADRKSTPPDDLLFLNNIVDVATPWALPFKVGPRNLYCIHDPYRKRPVNLDKNARCMPGVLYAETPGFTGDPPNQWPGYIMGGVGPFKFMDRLGAQPVQRAGQLGFRLAPDSKAVNAGAAEAVEQQPAADGAPDLGAIELGQRWDFPRPGPRWATFDNAPNRPPLPPDLDPHTAGMAADAAPAPSSGPCLPDGMEAVVATAADAQRRALTALVQETQGGVSPAETVRGVALVTARKELPGFAGEGRLLWEVRVAHILDGRAGPETIILVEHGTGQMRFSRVRGK